VNTHLPAFAASVAGLLVAILPAGFGAGLAGPFFKALRALAGGAALARAGAEGFDFAAVFLRLRCGFGHDLQSIRERKETLRALHHVWAVPAQGANPVSNVTSAAIFSSPRPIMAVENQKYRHHQMSSRGMIRISRARNHGHDW